MPPRFGLFAVVCLAHADDGLMYERTGRVCPGRWMTLKCLGRNGYVRKRYIAKRIRTGYRSLPSK